MDGVHPVLVCGVWNGGGVCCCWPALSSGVARAPPIPVHAECVLRSCHALCLAGCVVVWWCGGVCVCPYSFVWWGILHSLPPRRGGGWGHRGAVGGMTRVGGMVSEGRQCY